MSDKEGDNPHELVKLNTRAEMAADTAAALANMVPVLGGAVSNVLSGWAQDRRFARMNEVLWQLGRQVEELSDQSKEYVETEDFEDLLRETMSRVANERNEETRRLYAGFLADAVRSPGEPYDEQLRFLQTMERLQADHVRVLKALLEYPSTVSDHSIGSRAATLKRRLPDMEPERIAGLVGQLNDLRLTNLSLGGMMTAAGAEDTRSSITSFGSRFTRFLEEAAR